MTDHPIVSHEEWLKARLDLLAAEKELTHRRDALTRRRMVMPWERVEKDYRFRGPDGELALADLFDGRSQLIVHQFMFAPDWEEGCKSCSFWADHYDGMTVHLAHRDVTLAAVSRAPYAWAGDSPGSRPSEATTITTIRHPAPTRNWPPASCT
jgi:predicted dithiol-disulfide oxidoreductase (DUF899 family)